MVKRQRHWIDGPGPWWANGAWWALICAVMIGAAVALAIAQLIEDVTG